MNIQSIFSVAGVLLVLLSGLLLAPMGVAIYFGDAPIEGFISESSAFFWTFGLSLGSGLILWKLLPSGLGKLRDREGFAIVTLSWLSMSAFGALPIYLSGVCPDFIDAFFESTSGYQRMLPCATTCNQ